MQQGPARPDTGVVAAAGVAPILVRIAFFITGEVILVVTAAIMMQGVDTRRGQGAAEASAVARGGAGRSIELLPPLAAGEALCHA